MKSVKYLIAVVALTFAVVFGNAEPGVPRYVFQTVPTAGRQFPGLDKMSNGTMVLVYAERMGNNAMMSVCTSTDDGGTWSAPSRFATVTFSSLGLQRRPRVQIDRNGVMHAVFEDVRGDQSIHAFHCASTDNGATWSTPARVTKGLVSPHEDFCSAAIDSNNRLVVTFLSMSIDATDELVHVYMVTSTDNGATWTDPKRIDRFSMGGACECCQQNVAISPSGEIAVLYRSNSMGKRDVHLSRSTDNGATFSTPILVQSQPWNINQCPATGPSITFDASGALHISWWDARDAAGKAIAYYAKVLPGQTSTPTNIDLSSTLGNEAEYPSVATSPDGMNITCSFLTSMGTHIARSTNGGESFVAEKIFSTFMNNSSMFTVWTSYGSSLTMWQAQRETVYDIMQYRDVPTSVEENTPSDLSVYVDASGVVHVQLDEPVSSVVVFDILGCVVDRIAAAGTYVIQVQQGAEQPRYRCTVVSLSR